MKITRKEFIESLIANESIFLGTTKSLYEYDIIENAVKNVMEELKHGVIEKRNCFEHSNFLEFCNGSRLILEKCNFEKYIYRQGTVYICRKIEESECYGKIETVIYYLITKNTEKEKVA